MAKLERKNIKIFASKPNDATQVTSFLTAKDETPNVSLDPDVIQNSNYEKGWLAKGNNNLPQAEDMNGVMHAESYKTAYLYQMGIAEWNVTDEYNENSFCQVAGVLYKSLVNDNIGNNPTLDNGTNWLEIILESYVGKNIGNAEGVYAGKTTNNELQFKGIAVTGNGNISTSNDTITIEIGGGGTGDVYWGAIDGTLSNQSDLQQALNLKQNFIGYTPENIANKVTTVRDNEVATNTSYPTELATRTAIDDAIISANNYTDDALQNLSSDVFVLYANSWTDANTGTLTTVKPTGDGTTTEPILVGTNPTTIANFSYTTTSKTVIDPSFFYDIYIQCNGRDSSSSNSYLVDVKLTIEHSDVLGGVPSVLVDNSLSYEYWVTTTGEIRTPIKTQTKLDYPVGSIIKLQIKAMADKENSPISLLVYDLNQPIVISRNQYLPGINATCVRTQTPIGMNSQEDYNTYLFKQIRNCSPVFTATAPLNFYINKLTIAQANKTTDGYLTSKDWNTFNNKQNTISVSTPLSLSNNTISIAKASSSTSGYLSNTDWNTFNKKVSANNSTINIKMNGANKGSFTTNASSGATIDLGTVITNTSDCAKLASVNTFTSNNIFTGDIYLRKANAQDVILQNNGSRPRFNFTLDGQGYACTATKTAWNFTSDRRLKKNIINIQDGLGVVNDLKPVKYDFKNDPHDNSYYSGFIAQDVMEVIPDAVDNDGDGYYTLNMTAIIPYLTKSIQELSAKVESLEARIKELEK